MDASQYKDYVLIILFVKYLSDKEDDEDSLFTIPEGCRFSDFSKLKGEEGIGEAINKKLEAIKSANSMFLSKLVLPNFNDPAKLGKPKEMTDTLSKLIAAFESNDLDFSKNRSADDDILGDAYEYLMKNFAAESGKAKVSSIPLQKSAVLWPSCCILKNSVPLQQLYMIPHAAQVHCF